MSIALTKGRNRICKDTQGGIKKLYLAPFVKYSRKQIITDGVFLEQIPTTLFYEFKFSNNLSFSEVQNESEGGKYVDISFNIDLPGITETYAINNLMKNDYWVIYEDMIGNIRMAGLYNGVEITNISQLTGGAKTDFNGFKITMTSMQEKHSYFIEDLNKIGFATDGRLLIETIDFLLLETGQKIIL